MVPASTGLLLQGWGRAGLWEPGAEAGEGQAGGDQVAWDHIWCPTGALTFPFLNSRLESFLLRSEITTST